MALLRWSGSGYNRAMAETPQPSPASSSDFLNWGKEMFKDAIAKKDANEQRQTRPLTSPDAARKRTTLLGGTNALNMVPSATVSDLARLNVVFSDNAMRALFGALGPHDAPFSLETEQHLQERCLACLREVRDRLAPVRDLVPKGYYQGLTLAQALEGVTSKDIRAFCYFVREHPRFFIGKNLRFSEVFVAWLIDHGRAEGSPPPG